MTEIKILVVEDAPAVLEHLYKTIFDGRYLSFKPTLAKHNILVTYATTFEQAQALVSEKFDIVFLDHNLPQNGVNMNCGYTLIPEFRKHHHNTFIVGTSSLDRVSAPYDLKFEKSGERNFEELCEIVTKVLEKK